MAATTQQIKKPMLSWKQREILSNIGVTLLGLVVVVIFLMPLGYAAVTAFKSQEQIRDVNAPLLPSLPATYNYQSKDYNLYEVPLPDGTRTMALVKAGRESSEFVDPLNPDAGLVTWTGRWRTLAPKYEFNPFMENFSRAWDQISLGKLFVNTFAIAIWSMIGTLLSSILVAYGFARFRFPGKKVLFMILIATIILPGQVTLIPQYAFFRAIGWGGTWWPLIIPHFFANAYNVFLLRQYFLGIPRELDEAAMMDGASPFRILISVILPQSMPAVTAVAMFHFFWSWNDFYTPLIYLAGKEDLYTISVGLTRFNNVYSVQPGLAMAAALMVVAMPVALFFMAQRQFMQGIVVTGVEK